MVKVPFPIETQYYTSVFFLQYKMFYFVLWKLWFWKKTSVEIFIAEDRLKDRLAAAAREKLAQTSKEKQLQAERKRKAAMFLTMLKGTAPDKADASATDNGAHRLFV